MASIGEEDQLYESCARLSHVTQDIGAWVSRVYNSFLFLIKK